MAPDPDELGRGIRWLSEHTPDEATQQGHLRALRAAVAARPAAAPAGDVTTTHAWKRRVAMGTAWGVLVATPGFAAAENTKPGDLLYPVKRAGEPLRSLFDRDVAARHRLEELARLLDEGADEDQLRRALEAARAAAEDDQDRAAELDRLEQRLATSDVDVDDEPATRPSTRASEDESEPSDDPTDRPTDDDTEPSDDTEVSQDTEDSPDEPTVRPTADDEDAPDADDEPSLDDPVDEDTPDVDEDTPDVDDEASEQAKDDEADEDDTPDEPSAA